MPRSSDKNLKLASHLWAALGYLAKKRVDKTHLVEGSSTKIDVSIVGKVGRSSIQDTIVGTLSLGVSSERASSSAAPVEVVVALCLAELPTDEARAKFIERTVQYKEEKKTLPTVDSSLQKTVKAFLTRLRSTTQGMKAGDLTFDLDG